MQQEDDLFRRASRLSLKARTIDDFGQGRLPLDGEARSSVELTESVRYRAWMVFAAIDHWIGRTLFVPPIVKLCQLTSQSQFAISRLFWFFTALDGLYRANTAFGMVLWGGMSVFMMVIAARRADHPTMSFMFFRLLAVVMFGLDMMRGITISEWAGVEFWIFVLVAEYAAIIRTIPPRTSRKVSAKGVTVK